MRALGAFLKNPTPLSSCAVSPKAASVIANAMAVAFLALHLGERSRMDAHAAVFHSHVMMLCSRSLCMTMRPASPTQSVPLHPTTYLGSKCSAWAQEGRGGGQGGLRCGQCAQCGHCAHA